MKDWSFLLCLLDTEAKYTNSKFENDLCIPKYDIMQRICYVLNVELETLEKDLPKTF